MPSLKDYRDRIASVKSTRKITSAMKMVAASKLKKAQSQAEASQPYATAMAEMLARVAASLPADFAGPKLLVGTGADQTHLLIVVSSDRGLCGGFNGNLARRVKKEVVALKEAGKTVKIICAGRKVYDVLKLELKLTQALVKKAVLIFHLHVRLQILFLHSLKTVRLTFVH